MDIKPTVLPLRAVNRVLGVAPPVVPAKFNNHPKMNSSDEQLLNPRSSSASFDRSSVDRPYRDQLAPGSTGLGPDWGPSGSSTMESRDPPRTITGTRDGGRCPTDGDQGQASAAMTSEEDSDQTTTVKDAEMSYPMDRGTDDYPLTQSVQRHSRTMIRSEPDSTDSDPEVTFKDKRYLTGKNSKEIKDLREKLCELQREYRGERGLLSTEQLRQLQHSPTNVVDPLTMDTTNEKEYLKRAINKLIQKIDEVKVVKKTRNSKERKVIEETPSPPQLEPEMTSNMAEPRRSQRTMDDAAESSLESGEVYSSPDESKVRDTSRVSRYQPTAVDYIRAQSPLMPRLGGEWEYMKNENDRLRHELWQLRAVREENKKLRGLEYEVQMLRTENKVEKQENERLRGLEYEVQMFKHEVQMLKIENERQKEAALRREKSLLEHEAEMIKRMDKMDQRLQDVLDALKHKTDKPRASIELSQGADVTTSQDERLTRRIINEVSQDSAAERRPTLSSSGLSSSMSVCLGSSTSYQQGSDHELRRLLDTSGEGTQDEVGIRRTPPRDKDQERRSQSKSRDMSESRLECRSKEIQKPSERKQYQNKNDDQRTSPTNRSDRTERKQYQKEYDDQQATPSKRRKSALKSATSDSDNSSGDDHRLEKKKESKTIRFSDQMSESGNESKREQGTPKKKYRKRRCETVYDTEESDVEVISTKRGYLKPQLYDGTTPLDVFLCQFDNCCQHNEWRIQERLAHLKGALTGNAAQILLGDQGKELDYSDLREELQKCFGVEGHQTQYRMQLKLRRRQPNESLRTLYQDIRKLFMLAYPGPKSDLKEEIAIGTFIDSLDDPDLERRVKDRFPKTLSDTLTIALSLEANNSRGRREGDIRQERPKQYRTDLEARAVAQSKESPDEKMDWIMREMQRMNDRYEQKEKESVNDRLGHWALESRSPPGGNSNQSRRSPEWRRGNGNTSMFNNHNQEFVRTVQSVPIPPMNQPIPLTSTPMMTYPVPLMMNPYPLPPPVQEINPALNPPVAGRICKICHSTEHFMSYCPQAICGGCHQKGHIKQRCPFGKPSVMSPSTY